MFEENALRINSVFWSKLGFCYDPPRLNAKGKPIVLYEDFERFAKFHKDFSDAGVKIHTSVLFSGWVGVDQYDYELIDLVLDALFKNNQDIYYIPRIKLNVPIDWCKENPEEVFVYYEGPRNAKDIRRLVGTEKHDFFGYDTPIGKTSSSWKDDRPNVGGVISNQSFSSKKWLNDAGEALYRLISYLENGPYADRIIAYHIAYGVCGETCLWGRYGKEQLGDYGVSNRKAFFDWGMERYGSLDALRKEWNLPELNRSNVEPPSPQYRQCHPTALRDFFRVDNRICIDYDRFTSEVNANAIEYFGKLVKESTGGKMVGAFYGYFLECYNAAYSGWLEYKRILNSPYVDFLAGPKSYYRCQPGEPGGELGPAQSVNRRKIWMDELDNRTHLCTTYSEKTKNIQETRTVMWREFAKNLAHGSGFWWMDLGGGWFDSPEILREIATIEQVAVNLRQKPQKSIAEILLIVDEESIYYMTCNSSFHRSIMQDMVRNSYLCGAPVDMYRMHDLETLDLSQYKLIVFLNTFKLIPEQWQRIKMRIPLHATLMWNYAPGVLNSVFSLENIEKIIGMRVAERNHVSNPRVLPEPDTFLAEALPITPESSLNRNVDYPLLHVVPSNNIQPLAHYEDGLIAVAAGQFEEYDFIYSAIPFLGVEHLRQIAMKAGCHLYTPANCTVYGDSRFISVFPKVLLKDEKLRFKNKVSLESTITGRQEIMVKSIDLDLEPKGMDFFQLFDDR